MSLGSWFELWCVIYTNNKNLIKISHACYNKLCTCRKSLQVVKIFNVFGEQVVKTSMSLGSWFELWCVIYTNNKNLIKISHVIINYALVERASKLSRFSMSLGNRLSRLQCL